MRGGTSRGLFFHEHDLPLDPTLRDRVIMGAVGAPDPRQVDGLGGADALLSKVAVVSGSMCAGIDVECEFANISPNKDRPTYGTNCGNLIAAVALFAIDEGLVSHRLREEPIRIKNRNSGSLIEARVGLIASKTGENNSFSGMPDSGVCVDLDFIDPVGATTGRLLPTGVARESFVLGNGRTVEVSVIDAGALYVFVRACDFDLTATESADQMQSKLESLVALEHLRAMVAHSIGLVETVADATRLSPDVPKIAFVAPGCAGDHSDESSSGHSMSVDAMPGQEMPVDLVSRIVSSQNYHRAYAVTGAIATAVAAAVPGSVVQEAAGRNFPAGTHEIKIGHPAGVMTCRIESQGAGTRLEIARAGVLRTTRRVMQGTVVVPNSCFQ